MKISVNDVELFTLTETQKRVIQNDISKDVFEEDMKRRLKYILMQKYDQSCARLKKEWEPKLVKAGAKSLPTDMDTFANLVFSRPEYKDRSARDLEDKNIVLKKPIDPIIDPLKVSLEI